MSTGKPITIILGVNQLGLIKRKRIINWMFRISSPRLLQFKVKNLFQKIITEYQCPEYTHITHMVQGRHTGRRRNSNLHHTCYSRRSHSIHTPEDWCHTQPHIQCWMASHRQVPEDIDNWDQM